MQKSNAKLVTSKAAERPKSGASLATFQEGASPAAMENSLAVQTTILNSGAHMNAELATFASKRFAAYTTYWDTVKSCTDPACFVEAQSSFVQGMLADYSDEWFKMFGLVSTEVQDVTDAALKPVMGPQSVAVGTKDDLTQNVCV